MNWYRIKAVVFRHLYLFRHDFGRLIDSFYWPAMDIILWGLTSQYIQKSEFQVSNVILIFLSALIFWQVVWRAQYEITVNLLEEQWSENLINLFCSPLKVSEWSIALLILGFIKMLASVAFTVILARILYAVNLLTFGLLLVPFFVLLLMTGWWVGFTVCALLIRFGREIQSLAWSGVFVLAPFSAIYYPVSSLPFWAQIIAKILPSSYIFEGMRKVIITGQIPIFDLSMALLLNLLYLFLSIKLFNYCFKETKKHGLARLNF